LTNKRHPPPPTHTHTHTPHTHTHTHHKHTHTPQTHAHAQDHGVEYTTFDTESELHKVAALHTGFKLVLRIRADDPGARVPLGIKYGAGATVAGVCVCV